MRTSDRKLFVAVTIVIMGLLGPMILTTVMANTPPVPVAGDDKEVKVGEPVLFGASDSYDQDGDSLSYSWDFDDSDGIQSQSILIAPSHTYDVPGTYTVTLTVSDGTAQSTDVLKVKVDPNYPPIVDLGKDFEAGLNEWVFFDSRNTTDRNNDPLTYSWDFDVSDGISEQSSDQLARWKFNREGTFTVTLTVSDGEFTSTGTVNVTIRSVLNPIAGKKFDGGGSVGPSQRTVYMIPLSKGKGLKVKIEANGTSHLNYYLMESDNFFKFTSSGDIMAISAGSKEEASRFSYSIKASKTDDYYIVIMNPATATDTVDYTIRTETVSATEANSPGLSGAEVVMGMVVALGIMISFRKRSVYDPPGHT